MRYGFGLASYRTSLSSTFRAVKHLGVGHGAALSALLVYGLSACSAQTTSPDDGSFGLTTECLEPDAEWIWCDDFEQDRLSSYFEVNTANGKLARVAGVGIDGSAGIRVRYEPGTSESGNLKLAFGDTPSAYMVPVDGGTRKYREIYWRHYLRHDPAWRGGHPAKLSRATVFTGSDWSQAMIAHLWGSGNYLLALDPASGTDESGTVQTTGYNDFDDLRWLGINRGRTPIFDDEHVGAWYCIEAHVRLNDRGQENGVFEFWIDETLEARSEDLNWLGSYDAFGINAIFFENYWNETSPVVQERYWDNIVVSTERIGCGGG